MTDDMPSVSLALLMDAEACLNTDNIEFSWFEWNVLHQSVAAAPSQSFRSGCSICLTGPLSGLTGPGPPHAPPHASQSVSKPGEG